jgi:hypothetical protein
MKVTNTNKKISEGWVNIDTVSGWKTGVYFHPKGIIAILQTGDERKKDDINLILDFIKDGHLFSRIFRGKEYTDIGISRKCKEFIEDM